MATSMLAVLPPGLLPRWLVLVSIVSALNSVQAYVSRSYTGQLYNASPSNPLSSRTFGTWTFLSAIIRMYAAYNISNPPVYDIAMWSYGIALVHFLSEWLVFGSARAKGRILAPMGVATASLAWMASQRESYLG